MYFIEICTWCVPSCGMVGHIFNNQSKSTAVLVGVLVTVLVTFLVTVLVTVEVYFIDMIIPGVRPPVVWYVIYSIINPRVQPSTLTSKLVHSRSVENKFKLKRKVIEIQFRYIEENL